MTNPGFEEGTSAPSGWVFTKIGNGTWEWDTTQKHSGSKCVRLILPAAEDRSIFKQDNIPVSGGNTYALSTYYMMENMTGQASIQIYWYDAQKNYISWSSKACDKNASGWTKVSQVYEAPANASYAMILLYIMSGTGSVRFDDVEMVELLNAQITPTAAQFDKNPSESADIFVTMDVNGHSLNGIDNGTATLTPGTDYSISVNTVTIKKEYLSARSIGTVKLLFDFDVGIDPVLDIYIIDSSPNPVLEMITVDPDRADLLPGESVQLNVSGLLSNGSPADLTAGNASILYTSSDENIAAVNENGLLEAIATGAAVVTVNVTMGQVTKEASVPVQVVPDMLTSPVIIYDFRKLGVGSQQTQPGWYISDGDCESSVQSFGIAALSQAIGQYITLDFYVPKTGRYAVSYKGAESKGGGVGTVILDGSETIDYNYSADVYTFANLFTGMGTFELTRGYHQLKLQVKARGSYGYKGYYQYPSEFMLEYLPALESVSLTADKTSMLLSQTAKVDVTGKLEDGSTADLTAEGISITYGSSNENIAAVSSTGTVTGVAAGTATITARVSRWNVTREASLIINLRDASLESVTLSSDKNEIAVGETTKLLVSGKASDGGEVDLKDEQKTFQSSDPEVAEVDERGNVTGKKPGNAVINVAITLGGIKSAATEITVAEPALETVTLTANKTELILGRTVQLAVSAKLTNGDAVDLSDENVAVDFLSSDDAIAAVDESGLVTATGAGTAVITARVTLEGVTKEAELQISVVDPADIQNAKTRSTYYTEEKVSAARNNVQNYDWARAAKEAAVIQAEKYLALGDEYLWELVTPQSIPRSIFHLQRTKAGELGCPVCGQEINKFGSYPWKIDHINDPWKLTCPNCNTKFPTNDFGAYYKSGIDENGVFNPDLADKNLLKNTLYPEKGETWGVDDGYGWKNGDDVWTFIAYYNHWGIWYSSGLVNTALNALRDAYIYTGDTKYARSGLILLDRIADVYPSMDITDYLWEEGFDNGVPSMHTAQGKILHDIWETGLVSDFIRAYDAFYPALKDGDTANVVPFLSDKSDSYDLGVLKYSAAGIKKNIEDNILRQVFPAFKNSQIRGNFGMHQTTLALAAVVLDEEGTTQEMLDYNFRTGALEVVTGSQYPNGRHYYVTGGNILSTLVNDVDRDGFGNEAAPGYNAIWISQMLTVADVLDGYDRYPAADLYKNVKFNKMFQSQYPLMMIGSYIPSIGDSGSCGQAGLNINQQAIIKAFEKFGDPVYAQAAYLLNGNTLYGIHGDIFSSDPEKVTRDIKEVIDTLGTLELGSDNLTGYGFAALRDGKDYTMKTGSEYNFMQLPIVDSSGKEIKTISFPALFYRSGEAGDYITFEFVVTDTDEYNVCLRTVLSPAYGKYILKIDGVQVGGEYDAYGPAVVESELTQFGKLTLNSGVHRVTLECTGKNALSTNYLIGLRYLVLLNKDAEEAQEMNELYGNMQRDIWMYYGRNTGHGHKDTLNIGIHAFDLNLAPDLGYPEYTGADPERLQWTSNTISHNTVVVDKGKQENSWVGIPLHFDSTEMVDLVDVEAPKVYPQTELYRRTTAMIKVDDANSYSVDFFRVKGGNDHHFSFHSNEAVVTTEDLNLIAQPTGTYAGPDVPFAQRPANDSVDGSGYMGSGFHYLYNVERDEEPPQSFSIDWQQTKDPEVHLRMTMLGELDDVAIADGEPPQNKPGNPPRLKYLIAHRSGQDLYSVFTSVLEPYKDERYIESVSFAAVKAGGQVTDSEDVKALKVVLKDGRTDYIVNSVNPDITYTIDDKFSFKGFFGVYSEKSGSPMFIYTNEGVLVSGVESTSATVSGSVVDFTRDMGMNNEITLQLDNPEAVPDDLAGRFIYVQNDGARNAAYRIKGIKASNGDRLTLDIGDTTLIRSWADVNDFSKGYIYDVAVGSRFSIPLSSYQTIVLEEAALSAEKDSLTRGETTVLTVDGMLSNNIPADLSTAVIEYVSSRPDVVRVENGVLTAYEAGTAEVFAKVTLNGVTVQSNVLAINVTTSIPAISKLVDAYIQEGSLTGPLVPQLTNSLSQAEHQLEKGDASKAAKHIADFLKHLNNPDMLPYASDTVRNILDGDAKALIEILKN